MHAVLLLYLIISGRINSLQLGSRYGDFDEQHYRQQLAVSLADYLSM